MLTACEPYALWAIEDRPEADHFLRHPKVVWTPDVLPDFLRKVRILNGAHTALLVKARPRGFATLVWPKAADRGRVERLARGIGLARDLINTPAEHMGPAELAGAVEDPAGRPRARFRPGVPVPICFPRHESY